VAGLLGVVVVDLAIITLVGIGVEDRTSVVDGRLLTTENLVWEMVVPLGAAATSARSGRPSPSRAQRRSRSALDDAAPTSTVAGR
jgi:hypothetical protein